MSNMAIVMSPKELESTIEVLSSAEQTFQLTRSERLSYYALMVSVDVAAACVITAFVIGMIFAASPGAVSTKLLFFGTVFGTVSLVSILVGIISLALNIPLFRKTLREGAKLKELGLISLSQSLWKEGRRRRWISRARQALLIVAGIIYLYVVGLLFIAGDLRERGTLMSVLLFATAAALVFTARYLRNQRERMDLTASAEELGRSLQSLRQRDDNAAGVSVPFELLEATAKIESAQIAQYRKDAVLQSVASRPTGYAIAFDRGATEQRATLDVADQVELGDLVAQLSTDGAQLGSQAAAGARAEGAVVRGTARSNRVGIEYLVDQASRDIRIIAVRHEGDGSHTSLNGAAHA